MQNVPASPEVIQPGDISDSAPVLPAAASARTSQRWFTAQTTDCPIGAAPSSSGFLAMLTAFSASGGTSRGDTLAAVLKQHRSQENASLARLMVTGRVFCFPWRSSLWVPMFQFDLTDLSVKDSARQVRSILEPAFKEWALAAWFARPHPLLHGQLPANVVDTQFDAVCSAADWERSSVY